MAIDVLSLGAGVQSTTLFLMSCRGILPKLDAAVFADTGWESSSVYEVLDWLEDEGEQADIPIYRVSCGRNIRDDAMVAEIRPERGSGALAAMLPYHVTHETGAGLMKRQCTRNYKIRPIQRFVKRTLLGFAKGTSAPIGSVRQWMGISSDEVRRVRQSKDRWCENVYPLCGIPRPMLDRNWSRAMCIEWLAVNYPGRTVTRSACIGCPFQTNREWRARKRQPREWADAVEVDERVRNSGGNRGQVFLHPSCRPLAEANLDEDQAEFWDDECTGYCGA